MYFLFRSFYQRRFSWCTAAQQLTAASRQTFAFARDGALPFSRFLYKVNPYTHTPVVCVWFCALGAMLLGLFSFASPAAITSVFTMAVVCQYLAYSIPILARFWGGASFRPGPFSLGSYVSPCTVSSSISLSVPFHRAQWLHQLLLDSCSSCL